MEVDMDVVGLHHHHHHHQQQETLESMLQQVCTKPQDDKKPRPEEAVKCPRCDSSNTKFCYYNNYSLTQPRYFCKSCRRYWTKGGTLRNVPVGGGCRKNNNNNNNKRNSSSSAANSSNSSPSKMRSGPQQHPLNIFAPSSNNHILAGLPQFPYDSTSTDLSLAFARLQRQQNGSIGYDHFDHIDHHLGANTGDQLGFLGFLDNTSNMVYNGGNNNINNIGNGDMGLNNVGVTVSHDQQQLMWNPVFLDDHQEHHVAVKQEACNMMSSASFDVGLMGFQGGNMVHEVESGRSMIGGWNGIGATNWHGLINSPLM